MAGKFYLRKFSEINLDDSFFDTLKKDYPGSASSPSFSTWFDKKAQEGRTALVFYDEQGLGAFVCIKNENEPIKLKNQTLPAHNRIKISTMKIAERFRGQRLGEGAIGLVLWKWQKSGTDEIYVTAFDKQDLLISQLEKFGFNKVGFNLNGEGVYVKIAIISTTMTLINLFRLSIRIFKQRVILLSMMITTTQCFPIRN